MGNKRALELYELRRQILEQITLVEAKLNIAIKFDNLGLVDCYRNQLKNLETELELLAKAK